MSTVIPMKRRRWIWPEWPAGLFEDADGHHYDGVLDRHAFDRCVRAVIPLNAPALLSDLAADGVLDLARPDMTGAVAKVWFTSEHSETGLSRDRWVEMFRANGFNGDRPAESVTLYRGCVPMFVYFNAGRHMVEVDDFGHPADPYGEIVDGWHTALGMSWTSDRRSARRFAQRTPVGREYGQVYTATVDPENLLAIVGADYIVDPVALNAGNVALAGLAAVPR